MEDFEKLGAFYLGRTYDLKNKTRGESLVLYDSKDLVTHGVCVGMTGSGKTGLCIGLLEEAAIDGIPSIVIDPKGDLANLLLTFPDLRAEDFAPWINEEDAQKKNLSSADYAAAQAENWKKGLGEWGQDGARIKRLRDAADFRIYTPGSNAGFQVSILKSFAAPPQSIRDDNELMAERVNTTVTSLLGLLGIDADPIKSREHILISNILNSAWAAGKDLGHRRVDSADSDTADDKDWRARYRLVLSIERSLSVGHGAQQLTGGSRFQRVDGGRAAGHSKYSAHDARETARRDLFNRAFGRRRTNVFRFAPSESGTGLDAHTIRHDQLARDSLHG
jgi:hypothetical protein